MSLETFRVKDGETVNAETHRKGEVGSTRKWDIRKPRPYSVVKYQRQRVRAAYLGGLKRLWLMMRPSSDIASRQIG